MFFNFTSTIFLNLEKFFSPEKIRESMKKLFVSILTAMLAVFNLAAAENDSAFGGHKVGVQCYTFNKNTLEETLAMLKPTGIKYLQAYGGQKVGFGIDAKFSPDLPQEDWAKIKKFVEDSGFKIMSFGTSTYADDEAIKKMFQFAEFFGAKEISCEAVGETLKIYDKYSKAFDIKVSLHNHDNEGKHNDYYDPYVVRKAIEGTSVYASPDTGNWGRAGIDAVAALKVLEGKLYSLHLKDLSAFGVYKKGKSEAYGTGVLNMKNILAELDRQNFDGILYLESGENSKDPMPYVKGCLDFLEKNQKGKIKIGQPRKIAVQAYTFRKFTIEEMADMLGKIGVHDVQLFPGQKISNDIPEKFSANLPKDLWEKTKIFFKEKKINPVSFGVVGIDTPEDAPALMEFLHYFGIPQFATEVTGEKLTAISKAAKAYNIEATIHHHASDSKSNTYYNPHVLAETIKEDGYMKAMPDTGHWARSGIDVIDSIKLLNGKIAGVHFKDHSIFGDLKSKCTEFGKGALNIPEILDELDRQNFDGYLIIENEHISDNPMPVVTQCVEYLRSKPVGMAFSNQPRKVALQTYSLSKLSFEETLQVCQKLGIKAVEAYGREGFCQRFTKEDKSGFGYHMPKEKWQSAKDMLAKYSVELLSIGVNSPKDEEDAENLFSFAKFMGVKTIATEVSGAEKLEFMDKLSVKYGIKVGIHNHAKDLKPEEAYYNPTVIKDILGKYPNLLAAPDNGHWARSGIDSVEGFKILQGKIMEIHFKDTSAFDDIKAECKIYAKGVLNMSEMLRELDRQNFDGYYVIEYEVKDVEPIEGIERCLNYLKLTPKHN